MPLLAEDGAPEPRVLEQVVDALVGGELGGHRGCQSPAKSSKDG